jgi:hypothetical protein
MLVEAMGSRRGREGSTFVEEGRMPACWCCNSALPRAKVLGVRVSAAKGRHESVTGRRGGIIIGHTATAEAGTNAVNAFCSFDFSHDDITGGLNTCPNFGRTVQKDWCIVSGGGDERRHGKTVAIDDDSFAISERSCGYETQHDRRNESSYL